MPNRQPVFQFVAVIVMLDVSEASHGWASQIDHSVVVIICIPIILKAVAVEIARPHELINVGIVVIILVIGPLAGTIDIFVGNPTVIMVQWARSTKA